LKEEALDRTLWRTRFVRGYGPVVRQTAEWMKWMNKSVIIFYVNRSLLKWHIYVTRKLPAPGQLEDTSC
jgi:hypothetical protein